MFSVAGVFACDESAKNTHSGRPDLSDLSPDVATGRTLVTDLPKLRLEPADLLSSTGSTPVRAVIKEDKAFGRVLKQGDLNTLASLISLQTYPEGTAVNTTIRLEAAQNVQTEGDLVGETAITFAPVIPLTSTWHALVVSPAAGKLVSLPEEPLAKSTEEGRVIARFHPASQPTVRMVQVCKSSPIGIGITFSENVSLEKTPEETFTLTQDGMAACSLQREYSSTYVMTCPGLDFQKPLSLEIAGLVTSTTPDKVPLTEVIGPNNKPIQFVPEKLVQHANCYEWTPDA
jgi:hypothetical protein